MIVVQNKPSRLIRFVDAPALQEPLPQEQNQRWKKAGTDTELTSGSCPVPWLCPSLLSLTTLPPSPLFSCLMHCLYSYFYLVHDIPSVFNALHFCAAGFFLSIKCHTKHLSDELCFFNFKFVSFFFLCGMYCFSRSTLINCLPSCHCAQLP